MDHSQEPPAYYNLIVLAIFAVLFFYFLYELAHEGNILLDAALMLVCGGFAIRNYIKWKEKMNEHIY
ncbi:MAG: hypothetical protein U5K31_10570 [Balneolaceae bacterium]|nr:hypothetical protein [Balneolaceae bacterium]